MTGVDNFFERPGSLEVSNKHMSVKEKIQQIEARTPRGGRKNNFQGIRNQTRTFHPKIANSSGINANFNANTELMKRTTGKAEELTIDTIEKYTPPEESKTKNIFEILSSKADEMKPDTEIQAEIAKEAERQKERELFNLPTPPKRLSIRSQYTQQSSAASSTTSGNGSTPIPERAPLSISISVLTVEPAEDVNMVHDDKAGVSLEVSPENQEEFEIAVNLTTNEDPNISQISSLGDESNLSSFKINSVKMAGEDVNVVVLEEDEDEEHENKMSATRKSTATVSTQSTFSSRSSLSTASHIIHSSVKEKRQPIRFNNDVDVIELQSTTTGGSESKEKITKRSIWRFFVCGV